MTRSRTTANIVDVVTAKGDIYTASAANTPANLAVGSDGSILVANSAASTGLGWAGQPYGNPVLNSAFQIWQRGTSAAIATTGNYLADRWQTQRAVTGSTVSRQNTSDTTNLPNIQYCVRIQRDSGNTATNGLNLFQSFESINSIPYAGKTVTLSFYARAGANYSSASNVLSVQLVTGTGTDQNVVMTGYTGAGYPVNSSVTLTTTWQRFTFTGSVASTTTEIGLLYYYTPSGTAGANDYFEITGVQIDLGSVALPFRTYAANLQGELAACQRYYWRNVAGQFNSFGAGNNTSTTAANIYIQFPVSMRIAPSALEQSGTASDYRISYTAANACTSVPVFNNATTTGSSVQFTSTGASLSSGGGSQGQGNVTTAYLGWSAEL